MASLAIKGHSTRGSKVIALLEMLKGKNIYNLTGTKEIWYILSDSTIEHSAYLFEEKGFTLEEFLEKFPYKVGDKACFFIYPNYRLTIKKIWWNNYCNDLECAFYEDDIYVSMKDLQPYKEETMEKGIIYDEIKVEDGKTLVVRKKAQLPKTYVECAKILDCFSATHIDGYKNELLEKLQELFICRDAYWKIAGEQMGLGKPWEPDWNHINRKFYCIYNSKNNIVKNVIYSENKILAFPTEEMRDAFYENFKELIETCKELL